MTIGKWIAIGAGTIVIIGGIFAGITFANEKYDQSQELNALLGANTRDHETILEGVKTNSDVIQELGKSLKAHRIRGYHDIVNNINAKEQMGHEISEYEIKQRLDYITRIKEES